MKFSQLFCPTLKDNPNDAEVLSHRLMIRAGLIQKVSSGIYSLLPLGLKIIRKFETIVREEMNRVGAQEVLMPMVIPSQLWKDSGRWEKYGPELCRLNDRHDNEYCLGPTHEEVVTDMIKQGLKSYRQLPQTLYQIQTKFRDEIRPRFGLMRGREFGMKDAYSFHDSLDSLKTTYESMRLAYEAIFQRCELRFKMVQADNGSIGGDSSAEFMVLSDTGEDTIVQCDSCGYAANIELALSGELSNSRDSVNELDIEKVHTPDIKTIEENISFLQVTADQCVKTLVYETSDSLVAVVLRGNDVLSEPKLKKALGSDICELASPDKVNEFIGAPIGFVGPVNLPEKCLVIADHHVDTDDLLVCGANEKDFHFKNAKLGRDFNISQFYDIREVQNEDACHCGRGKYVQMKGIEVGHIFQLGNTYSNAMGAKYLDEQGKSQFYEMGCYGIGIGRTVAAAIEQFSDEKGIVWPVSLAPFEVNIIIANHKDAQLVDAAQVLYEQCLSAGIDAILDDRSVKIGFKFKDSELIGFPYQVVVGKHFNETREVEIAHRQTGEKQLVSSDSAIDHLKKLICR